MPRLVAATIALLLLGLGQPARAQPVSYLSGVTETISRLADPLTPARERSELVSQVVARGSGAVPILLDLLQSPDPRTRAATLEVLAHMPLADFPVGGVVSTVLPLFSADPDPAVRVNAAAALGATRDAAVLEPLRQAVENEDRDLRQAAVQALGRLNRVETIPVLTRAARDRDIAVRGAALRGLFDLKAADALRLIKPTVTDPATADTLNGYLAMLESEAASGGGPIDPNDPTGTLVRQLLVREQRSLNTFALVLILLPAGLGAGRVFFKGTGRRVQFIATFCFVLVATPLAIWLTGFRTAATPDASSAFDGTIPFPESVLLLPTVLGATFLWTRTRPRLADLGLHTAAWTLGYVLVHAVVASVVPTLVAGAALLGRLPPHGPGWRDTLAVALLVLLASSIRRFGSPENHSKRLPRLSLSVAAFAWSLGLSVVSLAVGYVLLGAAAS